MFYIILICGIATAIVVATFAWVGLSTRAPEALDKAKWYRGRTMFFLVLSPILLVLLGFTLPKAPYVTDLSMPDDVVYVACKQFGYSAARVPLEDDQAWAAHLGDAPITVTAGKLVEFKVSSLDVNHSVAIYDPGRTLIAQTQAMPHYVNRLRVRFDKPGKYDIFCLEYCGVGHHMMHQTFVVQ